MNSILAVFLGGGLGSLARYGISLFIYSNFKPVFPAATLISNIISCTILALAVILYGEKGDVNNVVKSFVMIGFCGGFSTFSTFSHETVELIRSGNTGYAAANIALSVLLCVFVIFILSKNK
jgi:CrcB protein